MGERERPPTLNNNFIILNTPESCDKNTAFTFIQIYRVSVSSASNPECSNRRVSLLRSLHNVNKPIRRRSEVKPVGLSSFLCCASG